MHLEYILSPPNWKLLPIARISALKEEAIRSNEWFVRKRTGRINRYSLQAKAEAWMILDATWIELLVAAGDRDLDGIINALQDANNSAEWHISTRKTFQDGILEYATADLVAHNTQKYVDVMLSAADKKLTWGSTKTSSQPISGC